ncbi:SDR family oxidoreductase [Rubinisphaera margarita]|uniref:SDR family oxidoreductase n=1 Tax=Rubinisphaera margarita TaxID=2909586 RepID=UPI001EE888D7|nr:SDR family oxidoreductase [Rubinisphaera margarita]MCG6155105.1 SDR family oxidoreductase [Rubinisphaera margarita]
MSLQDQTAVVTGGGSGIGAAIARSLADAGVKVVISGRNLDKLKAVAEHNTDKIIPVEGDVADRDSVKAMFDTANKELGQIDILIQAAGINVKNRMMHNLDPADWDRMMDINGTGAFNCMRAVLPQMRERKAGTVITISSVAGIRAASLGGVGYNASKFAVTGLGISAGDEEKDHGIRFTNIYPGEVETPILEQRPNPVTDEHKARMLQPEDVAAAVMMVLQLPPRARIPELTIVPLYQSFV